MSNTEAQKWRNSLAPDDRNRATEIEDMAERLGLPGDAAAYAYGEMVEDIPQLARLILLRRIWIDLIRSWSGHEDLTRSRPAEKLIERGADPEAVGRLAQTVAYETAFGLLHIIDDGHPSGGGSGWRLMEIDGEGRETGRVLGALYESLLGADPSGDEGLDFLDEV